MEDFTNILSAILHFVKFAQDVVKNKPRSFSLMKVDSTDNRKMIRFSNLQMVINNFMRRLAQIMIF